jgi:hypothetical protein
MPDADAAAATDEWAAGPDADSDSDSEREAEAASTATDGPGGRDVKVPLDIYKIVTVFSTLFAVGVVVLGFILLDWGTQRATADLSDVNVLITVLGLLAIAIGAATYAFSTRFRAAEMGGGDGKGRSKDDAD